MPYNKFFKVLKKGAGTKDFEIPCHTLNVALSKCAKLVCLNFSFAVTGHSVSREVLTPQISKMIETLIFSLGWVAGNTHYAQFCPVPSPPYLHFFVVVIFRFLCQFLIAY